MDNDVQIDVQSVTSSLELHDALINESWDWQLLQKKANQRKYGQSTKINIGSSEPDRESFLGRLWRYWKEAAINRRLTRFNQDEAKVFSVQRIAKIDGILSDEETRKILAKRMMCAASRDMLQEKFEVLKRKYGSCMSECLLKRHQRAERDKKPRRQLRDRHPVIADMETTLDLDMDNVVSSMKVLDPLMNWSKQKSDISGRMMARIQNLASSISSKVKWSFLVEPGRPQTDLSAFFSEFDVLDHLFDKVELSADETSQKAFDLNCSAKARNRKLECVDCSRVKLSVPQELTKHSMTKEELKALRRRQQPADIFVSSVRNEHNHGDFIHASHVFGGPLLNKFILTQAPLPQTVSDFWRLIWQEQTEYIFMLCDACDTGSLGLMNSSLADHCPYYWPRYENEVTQFGKLVVKNEKLDTTIDPLFNVTYLAVWMEDDPTNKLKVQHWQWDWRNYTDFHWPFRLLLRSRQSKRPTVVQCMDGCGRSGTLVLIEIFLMQLLRGATSYEHPMITSATFLRLQRRHAVANQMQYLYAYRTVLYWIEPFVISSYHRFVLGLLFKNSGFIGKYDQLCSKL